MRRGGRIAAVLAALAVFLIVPARSMAADPCATPVTNAVACENSKDGTPPGEWQTQDVGDSSIQGYATSMSVNVGQTVSFKIKTDSTDYHIDILRLGYYDGDGAREVKADLPIMATLPQIQPACTNDGDSPTPTGLIDCGNWGVTASWTVPTTMVSGVYIAHLVRDDEHGGDSQIPFVVRNDASHSAVVLSTSDATWQAYNDYGGNSLYTCTVACPPGSPDVYKGANSVSYNRPFNGVADYGRSYLYYAEYPMIRFLEANGYDLSYVASKDVDANGPLLRNHKVFVASGHDEYWSGNMRDNVEAARDAGVNLAFFTGNEVFWKTRFESSARTLTTYKETHYNAQIDPAGPAEWTGTWADSRFSPPSDGGDPQNALTGQMFRVNSGSSDIKVPAAYGKLRLWRGTAAASLTGSQSLTLYPGGNALGYEWDVDADNGFRPAGLFRASSTTVSNVETFLDFGTNVAQTTQTHNLTLYRASSGALVFGAGTVQWAWGLDDTNAWSWYTTNPSGNAPDRDMQQATINLFADMGAQPYALLPGLSSAAKSTDTSAPVTQITSPSAGSTVADGTVVTVTGTASDLGGGQVAGVEVSTDGGTTWHPATTGTSSWTYTWTAHGNPTATLRARAVDDSGNLGAATAARTVNVTCSCTMFGSAIPPTADGGDTNGVEVGVKFKSDSFGTVNGIRFYKAASNTGTHVGTLWTADGEKLASATFVDETATGWQKVMFSSPISILPNVTYVASYYAPAGHYSISSAYYFTSPSPYGGTPIDAPPLHALRATAAAPNGLFTYAAGTTFPTGTFRSTNYYVDVNFTPSPAPGQSTGATATPAPGSANVTWTAPATGGPVTQYTITPYLGAVAQTATTVTVTGTPPVTARLVGGLTPGQSYTFKVTASNPTGAGAASTSSNAVVPAAVTPPTAPRTVEAAAASGAATVKWQAPAADGGRDITGYTVTPYLGATAQAPVSLGASATSATVSGLTNGATYTFQVKATNSQGASPAGTSNAVMPDDTIFHFGTPNIVDGGDGGAVELGVKFKADVFGLVSGVRFYKSAANTGTHTGTLWSASGNVLATATFTNETSSGWQQVTFSKPVAVMPGQMYVVSYYAPSGHYSVTSPGFTSAVDRGVLHALASGTTPNGTFAYGAPGQFPVESFNSSNYWVDVTYRTAPAPGAATGVAATGRTVGAKVTWTAPTTGGPVTGYVVTPYIGAAAQTPTTITGTPLATEATISGLTAGQTYTFKVTATNPAGNAPASAASNAVVPDGGTAPDAPTGVTAAAGTASARVSWVAPANDGGFPVSSYTVTPYIGATAQTPVQVSGTALAATVTGLVNQTAYTFKVKATNQVGTGSAATSNAATPTLTLFNLGTPAVPSDPDGDPVELGVKFKADEYGLVSGIRFYKSALNTGTHTGSLWTATGSRLAQVTFTDETASGWQVAKFDQPVEVLAGTTYVASYFAPNGHFASTTQAFNTEVDASPLHALSNSSSGGNGLFLYGPTTRFPVDSFNAANYWVDVTYEVAAVPGAPSTVVATPGVNSATVNWSPPTTGGPVTRYNVTPYIGSTPQTAKAVTGSPLATSVTFDGLTAGQAYTFKVTASNPNGSGAASAASAPVTPAAPAPPGAPRDLAVSVATGSALVSWTAPAVAGDAAITGYTVTPYVGSTAGTPVDTNASTTSATITGLTNGASTTFRVVAKNSAGTSPAAVSAAVTPNNTIFDLAQPAIIDSGDGDSVVVGVKFRSDVSGEVRGLRFHKAPANVGTHIGSLWDDDGTLRASGTFTDESASGWQQLDFSTPVSITAGTTYVASYLAPNGHYSATSNAFSSAFDKAPLHALANATSTNGVFAYSSENKFPQESWNATNYWVDVLFTPGS